MRAPRVRVALAGLAALAVTALSGCGGSTPKGGDPGNRRLKELSSDSVFTRLPNGATHVKTERHDAKYRKPGFSGGGWDGPTLIVTFKSTSPPAEVYRFYAQRAKTAGWKPTAAGGLGLTDRWAKTYSDGAPGSLVLVLLRSTPSEHVYRLFGGVAPVTS